ncbi:tetratricopeptide repeat protein [bacterium]|nr:tetratricopeptide repeat protein [bacterium]MBP9807283.1 tetratricopeptide repeat protein [bacterium]
MREFTLARSKKLLLSMAILLLTLVTATPMARADLQEVLAEILRHDEKLVDNRMRTLGRQRPAARSAYASFRLLPDGTYRDWVMKRGSGDPSFDVACRTAVDGAGFARFDVKPFIVVNASFRCDANSGSASLSSPDVIGGGSDVERKIAQRRTIHMNTIKIMQARITGAEKVLGPNHAKLSESINFLANEYKEIGDYPSAEKNFNRALTIRKVANGSESPEVAQTECDLGEMYLAKGDKTEAEKHFKLVIDMPNLKPQAKIKTMQAYAKLYLKDGKQTEANALYAQINDIMAGKISAKPVEKAGEKAAENPTEKTKEESNGSQK